MGNRFEVWVDDPEEGWYLEGTYDDKGMAESISDKYACSYVKEA